MIAHSNLQRDDVRATAQTQFEQMLPRIQRYAAIAFREHNRELRDELVAEVVARAYIAFLRLVERGRGDIAHPTPLAMFAVKHVKGGRRVGSQSNVRDVSSQYSQVTNGYSVQRLERYDTEDHCWHEIVVEDRSSGPAEIAAIRIDFADWLRTLSSRYRRFAECLATSESTRHVARRFHVSPSRISQIRRKLHRSWESFVEERFAVASPTTN